MASWKIEEFSVKPSGFLASWRYAAVYTDENGNVSVQAVPGKPFINLCVSAYNRENRAFNAGDVITSYCNLDTHTRYTIKAQDCTPFAYAETTLDDPSCGYLEPLPTPADPPNPYGSLIYVPYKYTEFCNDLGETVRLDIKRKFVYTEPQTTLQVDSFTKPRSGFAGGVMTIKVFVDRIKHTVFYSGDGIASTDAGATRSHAPDALITEICDFGTGTNLKVYSQATAPFAYVTEEPDALACAIPVSEPEYLENWGDEPIVLSYKGSDNKLDAFTPCECTAQFLCTEDFSLEEFYTNDEREFKGVVSVDGQTVFEGFIIPDSCQEPFAPTPYEVSIRMTDGLGSLKNITYPIPYAAKTDLKQTFLEVIAFCLASTNLTLNIRTICNVYETSMLNGPDDDPLVQASVNPLRFTGENGRLLDCYKVLESVLTLFKANIRQAGGEWVIVRPDELASQVARTRIYNNKAFFLYSETINPLRRISNLSDENDYPFAMDQHTLIGNAYKRASVFTEFAKSPAIVFNGDFENYDGQNWSFWTKYGGIDVSRVQNNIIGSGGATVPIEDYALQFNARADSGKWIQSNDILVLKEDTMQLSFDYSVLNATASIKLRVKAGDYYLTNATNGTDFTWVLGLSGITLIIGRGVRTRPGGTPGATTTQDRATIQIRMPEIPQTGTMVIQFFGPQQYDIVAGAARGSAGSYVENANFTPLDIDNVAVTKTSKTDAKAQDGDFHLAEQGGFYTTRPERTTVLFGDYVPHLFYIYKAGDPGQRPQVDTDAIVTDNLHAIYVNNAYSTVWYEYGTSSGRVPIGLLLAKSIMKSYQKPFRFISGSFRSEGCSMLNTYRFDFACIPAFSSKIFGLLSCDINLKSNSITSVNMAEMFDKYVKTVDVSAPHHPGDLEPPVFSNPNTPPNIPTEGIFTDEFGEPFR